MRDVLDLSRELSAWVMMGATKMAEAVANLPRRAWRCAAFSSPFAATRPSMAWTCGRAGEVVALVRQNGAGKSTLMAILAGASPGRRDHGPRREALAPRSPLRHARPAWR